MLVISLKSVVRKNIAKSIKFLKLNYPILPKLTLKAEAESDKILYFRSQIQEK